jgi:hypothetical protein
VADRVDAPLDAVVEGALAAAVTGRRVAEGLGRDQRGTNTQANAPGPKIQVSNTPALFGMWSSTMTCLPW